MSTLKEGDKAPDFTAKDQNGKTISLSDFKGKNVILYFYPKDDTPGCTSEASQFRDLYPQFQAKKARIVGVSRDSADSHRRFKEKFSIPFELLADTESKLCDAFGVIVEKNMYGKKSKGIARSTFLIDGSGKIVKVWPKVNVDEHADEVLASF